uniref:Dol-P-Glc:Glc(2)Man(9)GlcNAc(2)-PP-Dol alpha-1,2-glucosyltransferase n=2 Tax=Hirondellea gigas TaxID=1518452 RepID=A0A6A7FRS9_9CRUS
MRNIVPSPPPPYSTPRQQQQQQQRIRNNNNQHHHNNHPSSEPHHQYNYHNSNNRTSSRMQQTIHQNRHVTTRFCNNNSVVDSASQTPQNNNNNNDNNSIYTMTGSSSNTSSNSTTHSSIYSNSSSNTTYSSFQHGNDFNYYNGQNVNHYITPNSTSGINHRSRSRWYRKYCNHRVPTVVVLGVVVAVFSVTYLYMVVVYRLQPTPVVDEAFHIPQAQKYCEGRFSEWDPKLTTLPGLYLFSIGITGPVSWLFGSSSTTDNNNYYDSSNNNYENNNNPEKIADGDDGLLDDVPITNSNGAAAAYDDVEGSRHDGSDVNGGSGFCSVLVLRLVNVFLAPCILLALYSLMCSMHSTQSSEWSCLAGCVCMVLLPPLFWFYSLYYTEPLSTMLVLLLMLLHCHQHHLMAAAIGGVSIMVRQTNIVWVLFLLVLRVVDTTLACLNSSSSGGTAIATLHSMHDFKVLFRRLRRLVMQEDPWSLLRLVLHVLGQCFGHVFVLLLFALFVYTNGGLVLGDKSAHQATLHLTQVLYFFLFVLLFSPTLAVNSLPAFLASCCKHPKTTSLLLVVTLSVIHNNTLVHPYLLADNRHYTFYLWNRLYGRHIYFRYLMAPFYLFGGYLTWNVCLEKRSNFFRLAYMSCVALSIVPQMLLEPRYFILPFLLARIQKSPSYVSDPVLENCDESGDGITPACFPPARGNPARFRDNASGSPSAGFRGNPGRFSTDGGGGVRGNHPARSTGSRGGGGSGGNRTGGGRGNIVYRGVAILSNFLQKSLKYLRKRLSWIPTSLPFAHIGWEFLYYFLINLATLAIFGSKTFWWKDFSEPQRIMW